MSRELKFRAWDTIHKQMIQVGRIDFDLDGTPRSIYDVNRKMEGESYGYMAARLMQYTGLKDKNGVEAYHSDICKDKVGKIGTIQWSDENARWEVFFGFGKTYLISRHWFGTEVEVIGNRYENPGLLEK